jgi:hypothetical protein
MRPAFVFVMKNQVPSGGRELLGAEHRQMPSAIAEMGGE